VQIERVKAISKTQVIHDQSLRPMLH